MAERVSLVVPVGVDRVRADRFVADATGLSRAHVQRLIREGRLTRGAHAMRANVPVFAGDSLELDVPDVRPLEVEAEPIPLDVVYGMTTCSSWTSRRAWSRIRRRDMPRGPW